MVNLSLGGYAHQYLSMRENVADVLDHVSLKLVKLGLHATCQAVNEQAASKRKARTLRAVCSSSANVDSRIVWARSSKKLPIAVQGPVGDGNGVNDCACRNHPAFYTQKTWYGSSLTISSAACTPCLGCGDSSRRQASRTFVPVGIQRNGSYVIPPITPHSITI